MKHYSITIPKPCNEDWSKMTPTEKGRFCNSCTKTVVDFTKMSSDEITNYLSKNKEQRICGHIKQNQLHTINLKISESVFKQHMSFHKLFLLVLLITMGTSLFSCKDTTTGELKRIETVEVIEHKNSQPTATEILKDTVNAIQLNKKKCDKKTTAKDSLENIIEGEMIFTLGDIEYVEDE